MKRIFAIILLSLPLVALAQDQKKDEKPATLRSILLEQIKTTHNNKDWFVPANVAVAGLTAEPKFSGNNDETFTAFDAKQWAETVQQLDKVLGDLEKFIETADDKTIEKNASTIAHIGTHNAYHIGQIIYIRRLQGSWNPENGVK